jgi:hypothetical protein
MPIYINKNGQQSGPYEDHIVIDQLRSGVLAPDDMAIRHGDASWQRLGDMFPGVAKSGFAPPIGTTAPAPVTPGVAPAKRGGGCLKFGLIGTGILFLLLGVGVAIGSRFIPSASCDYAESDARKIDKLKSDLDKATKDGKFDRIGPLQMELNQELAGATVSQRYCNDDKFRDNLIGGAGGVLAVLGFLMAVIGLFVGRRK